MVFQKAARGVVFPLAIVIIWSALSNLGWLNSYILPSPLTIWNRYTLLLGDGQLAKHFSASLYRVSIGFLIALAIAVPVGFLLGLVPKVRNYLALSLNFFQQVPGIAWIPMFILWLGIGEESKIAIIVYSAFFPILLNTIHGVESTDIKLKEVAYTYGLSKLSLLFRVYLPSSAPSLCVGMRLGLSFCWRSLVAVELLGASKGLGYLIQAGREMAQTDLIFVGVLTIGLTGMLFDTFFQYLEKKFFLWKDVGGEE